MSTGKNAIIQDNKSESNDSLLLKQIQHMNESDINGLIIIVTDRADAEMQNIISTFSDNCVTYNPIPHSKGREKDQTTIMRDRSTIRRRPATIVIPDLKWAYQNGLTTPDKLTIRRMAEMGTNLIIGIPSEL